MDPLLDLIYVVVVVAFFALSWGFIKLFERM
jgi:hypothetical protein